MWSDTSYCSLNIAPDPCYRKTFEAHERCSHLNHAVERTVALQVIGDAMERIGHRWLGGFSEDWSMSFSAAYISDINALVARCPGWVQFKYFRNKHDRWQVAMTTEQPTVLKTRSRITTTRRSEKITCPFPYMLIHLHTRQGYPGYFRGRCNI